MIIENASNAAGATSVYRGASTSAPNPSSLQTGTTAWFTDKPDSRGGAFVVRGTSTPGTNIWDRVGGGPVAIDTWENCNAYHLPDYDGCEFIITDIGSSRWFASNSKLQPVNGRCMHARLKLPIFLAPTFTGTTNGAVTFGTAWPTIVNKCYVYYPANSLVSGQAAGFYYTEFSSTTAAIAYNNLYTPAAGVNTDPPTNKVAFSGAVPGGSGVTGSDITVLVAEVPGGALGEYGRYNATGNVESNNSAGNKIPRMKFGGNTMCNGSMTNVVTGVVTGFFRNCGATNDQRGSGVWTSAATSSAVYAGGADTTVAQNVTFTLQTSNATELVGYSSLCGYIERFP